MLLIGSEIIATQIGNGDPGRRTMDNTRRTLDKESHTMSLADRGKQSKIQMDNAGHLKRCAAQTFYMNKKKENDALYFRHPTRN